MPLAKVSNIAPHASGMHSSTPNSRPREAIAVYWLYPPFIRVGGKQTNMEPIGTSLQRKLAATRLWWRATRLFGGVAWAASALICAALVCYHADRLMALSSSAREFWRLGIFAAGAAVLLILWLRTLLYRITDADLAADVERRFPMLRERLLTTISLMPALATADGGAAQNGFSRSISTALAEETQRDTADLN
jgi:hypothetical protein